jgi:hypothetical protein
MHRARRSAFVAAVPAVVARAGSTGETIEE